MSHFHEFRPVSSVTIVKLVLLLLRNKICWKWKKSWLDFEDFLKTGFRMEIRLLIYNFCTDCLLHLLEAKILQLQKSWCPSWNSRNSWKSHLRKKWTRVALQKFMFLSCCYHYWDLASKSAKFQRYFDGPCICLVLWNPELINVAREKRHIPLIKLLSGTTA